MSIYEKKKIFNQKIWRFRHEDYWKWLEKNFFQKTRWFNCLLKIFNFNLIFYKYIIYDLLKAKYRKSDVCKVLYDLIKNDVIQAIHCPTVKKIVFETLKSGHYPYVFTTKVKVLEYLKDYTD